MEIVHSVRCQTLRCLTSAGVMYTDIRDSYMSYTLRYLTSAGVMHTDILDIPAGVIH